MQNVTQPVLPEAKPLTQTAKNLKFLREKLDLTMYGMAVEMGISRSSLLRYENGERLPSIEMCNRFIAFAKEHGIDVDMRFLRPDLAIAFPEHSN